MLRLHSAFSGRLIIPPGFPKKVEKKCTVILTENVEHLGVRGEAKDVRKGRARNHLYPLKLAVPFTPDNRASIAEAAKVDQEEFERKRKLAAAARNLSKITVYLKRHVYSDGTLHSPITGQVLAEKLYKQHRITMDPSQFEIPAEKPIQLGQHTVNVKIDEQSTLPLRVVLQRR